MSDFISHDGELMYNVWTAVKTTRRYRNELIRYYQLLSILKSVIKKNDHLVDLGCGTGKMDVILAKNEPDLEITAIDISEFRLHLFQEQSNTLGIKQIQNDFFKMDFENIDLVLSQEVLEHLPDVNKALIKMKSFLKLNGYGLFCVPYNENLQAKMVTDPDTGEKYHSSGHLHSFTKEKFENYIKESEFNIIKTELIVSKRLVRWLFKLRILFSAKWVKVDDIMNKLFPHKAAYICILCQKTR